LPILFVLLGLKFDSGLSYREFVDFNSFLLEGLNLTRAPSYSLLQKPLKKLDAWLLHRLYRLLPGGVPLLHRSRWTLLASPIRPVGNGSPYGSGSRGDDVSMPFTQPWTPIPYWFMQLVYELDPGVMPGTW
jgi:hypothetical protein